MACRQAGSRRRGICAHLERVLLGHPVRARLDQLRVEVRHHFVQLIVVIQPRVAAAQDLHELAAGGAGGEHLPVDEGELIRRAVLQEKLSAATACVKVD